MMLSLEHCNSYLVVTLLRYFCSLRLTNLWHHSGKVSFYKDCYLQLSQLKGVLGTLTLSLHPLGVKKQSFGFNFFQHVST